MIRNFRSLFVFAALASVGAAHAVVVIDDFSTPQPRLTQYAPGTVFNTVSAGAFAFPTREQVLRQYSNLVPGVARNTAIIQNGAASYSSSMGVVGSHSLNYLPGTPRLDLENLQTINLSFLSNDIPLVVSAWVDTYQASTSTYQMVFSSTHVDPNLAPFSVLLSEWDSQVDWSNVVGVSLLFEPLQAGDFTLTQVEAVPEPASLLALGAGAAALVARRRRRS